MKKKLSVLIPKDLSDIKLKTIIEIHKKKTPAGQAREFMRQYGGQDPKDFTKDSLIAVWGGVSQILTNNKISKPPKKVGPYNLLSEFGLMKVGAYIELCNVKIDNFQGLHIALGLFYRKDHSLPYSEEELIETATYFYKEASAELGIQGQVLISQLMKMLMTRYPILFPDQERKNKKKDSQKVVGRKAYDMLMTLTQERFVDWSNAKQQRLADAFVYLEEKRKSQIKSEMRQAQASAASKAKSRR